MTIPGVRSEMPGERDKGKSFLITEMYARPAQNWASRAFIALAHSQVDIPVGLMEEYQKGRGDMEQLARLSGLLLVGNLRYPELQPLMDELMGCVSFLVNPGPPPITRPLHDAADDSDDIEEVSTRHLLCSEVIDLHVNFSMAAAVLNLIAMGSSMTGMSTPTTSSDIQTSR